MNFKLLKDVFELIGRFTIKYAPKAVGAALTVMEAVDNINTVINTPYSEIGFYEFSKEVANSSSLLMYQKETVLDTVPAGMPSEFYSSVMDILNSNMVFGGKIKIIKKMIAVDVK